jgi:serine/threonine protein phosphatase 1
MAIVRRFERNTRGRDFVVGDVHGEFAQLRAQLGRLGFDPTADRLFSVGDLVDRGANSPAALEWLAQPWFRPVLGNHEDMALRAWDDEDMLHGWVVDNGGGWWLDCDPATQTQFIRALRALPVAIEISTSAGRIGVVHADVPPGVTWEVFINRLEGGDERVRQHALWARSRVFNPHDPKYQGGVAGVQRIYCGHTPLHRPAVVGNVCFIDTGACYPGGSLTVVPVVD